MFKVFWVNNIDAGRPPLKFFRPFYAGTRYLLLKPAIWNDRLNDKMIVFYCPVEAVCFRHGKKCVPTDGLNLTLIAIKPLAFIFFYNLVQKIFYCLFTAVNDNHRVRLPIYFLTPFGDI